MFVHRCYDDRLAQAAYLIGCQRTGEAIVVDPPRDIAPLLAVAEREKLRITRVTETHIHADFVSGARELAAATGAQLLLSAEGGGDWQYRYAAADGAELLTHGSVIRLGGVRLEVWHTPGHTPEHLSFLVTDTARSEEPVAMLTGDFIFVGDVGRPDLLEKAAHVEGTMVTGARQLFASLQRTRSLPDHLQLWPGHGAGSACGKALGAMPTSTLGYERRSNWAFGLSTEAAFVDTVLDGQPTPPAYFSTMKRINRDGPPLLGTRAALQPSDPDSVPARLATGQFLDIRPAAAFAAGHLRGSLNIPLIRAFTTWAGWLLGYDRPITLIADSEAEAVEARRALASIGLDAAAEWLAADAALSVASASGLLTNSRRGEITGAADLVGGGRTVVDLREPNEWAAGHIPGAVHHPLGQVGAALTDLPRDTPLAVHCQAGTRSAIGASVLEAAGFTDVVDLSGGYAGWVAAGRPSEQE